MNIVVGLGRAATGMARHVAANRVGGRQSVRDQHVLDVDGVVTRPLPVHVAEEVVHEEALVR
jgi:hypothetical protein